MNADKCSKPVHNTVLERQRQGTGSDHAFRLAGNKDRSEMTMNWHTQGRLM